MPQIDLSILNQRQTPAFYADVLANRPAAGFIGRIFVSTNTFEFYRDNGTGWDLIGGPGAGTITGSGATGQVSFWNGASTITGSNDLFWDNVNGHFGIGTTTPGTALDVKHDQNTVVQLEQITATNDIRIAFINSGVGLWRLGAFYNAGANDFGLFDIAAAAQPVTVKRTTGQVLIGTSTVGAGKLVVASATSDNGVQIVGANAPSLRLDNAESGPTKRAGLGISTAVNNFIQGSADRDFCIFNGSTAAASPILFGVYDAGLTNVQEAARISAARNFLIGTTTDAGQKLQVNGSALINGISFGKGLGAGTSNIAIGTIFGVSYAANNSTGVGVRALEVTTGGNNTALGYAALLSNSSGTFNVGIGGVALQNTTTGGTNIGIGYNAGSVNTTGSNNIFIGNWTSGIVNTNSNWTYIGNTSTTSTYIAGNLLLNTTTDAGFKLDVNGTARVGSVFNTTSTFINLGNTSFGSTNDGINYNTSGIGFLFAATAAATSNPIFTLYTGTNTATSGTTNWLNFKNGSTYTFAPTSGTGVFNAINLAPIIFQTGGANGITRGLFINSTLTAAADYRAIETTIGNVCLGTTSGNVLIGTATSGASKLRIVGLPTSAAGLSSGDIYSNLGVLTIVP